MKKTLVMIAALLFALAMYYDLKVGTLTMLNPKIKAAEVVAQPTTETNTNYVEHIVNRGDTVLSIVEKYRSEPLQVSIDTVVQDFISLNQIQPEKIQPGKIYKFPVYKE